MGGPNLAYLTVLIWSLPAVLFMTSAALGIYYLQQHQISLSFMRFVEPMAIGFLAYGGFSIGSKVIKSRIHWLILTTSALHDPYCDRIRGVSDCNPISSFAKNEKSADPYRMG
jgi:chromate transporter